MPSEQNLQPSLATLLLLLAALCTPDLAHGAPKDLPETSGEELQDMGVEFRIYRLPEIAGLLLDSITSLQDEQFQRDFGEPVTNMTHYDPVRTKMPLLEPSVPCFPRNFNEPRCLRRIYAGLRTYEVYLDYLEKENLTSAELPEVKLWTKSLLQVMKAKVGDATIQVNASTPLHDEPAWKQRTFTHSILYNLRLFLKDATRALRHMKGFSSIRVENLQSKEASEKHTL